MSNETKAAPPLGAEDLEQIRADLARVARRVKAVARRRAGGGSWRPLGEALARIERDIARRKAAPHLDRPSSPWTPVDGAQSQRRQIDPGAQVTDL